MAFASYFFLSGLWVLNKRVLFRAQSCAFRRADRTSKQGRWSNSNTGRVLLSPVIG